MLVWLDWDDRRNNALAHIRTSCCSVWREFSEFAHFTRAVRTRIGSTCLIWKNVRHPRSYIQFVLRWYTQATILDEKKGRKKVA